MHLNVTLPKITVEQRTQLVKNMTETVGNVLDLPNNVRQRISIRFNMYDANETARGGHLLNGKDHPLCHVDVFSPSMERHHKQEMVRHLTTAFCETLGFKAQQREDVFITIHQFSPENIATGGRLLAELVHA